MLSLEIVTGRGSSLVADGLREVVFRRREERFAQGSEVAIFPGHAPLLMQSATGEVRWKDGKDVVHRATVGRGLVEVLGDQILVVTDYMMDASD